MIGRRIVTAALFMLSLSCITGCSLLPQEPSLPDLGNSSATDPPTEADRILSVSYFCGTYSVHRYFRLYISDGQVLFDAGEVLFGDEHTIEAKPVDHNALEELQVLFLDNGITHWDGFSEEADYVPEGYSFSLKVEYESGKHLIASGYEREPDNYDQGHDALVNYFTGFMGDASAWRT